MYKYLHKLQPNYSQTTAKLLELTTQLIVLNNKTQTNQNKPNQTKTDTNHG